MMETSPMATIGAMPRRGRRDPPGATVSGSSRSGTLIARPSSRSSSTDSRPLRSDGPASRTNSRWSSTEPWPDCRAIAESAGDRALTGILDSWHTFPGMLPCRRSAVRRCGLVLLGAGAGMEVFVAGQAVRIPWPRTFRFWPCSAGRPRGHPHWAGLGHYDPATSSIANAVERLMSLPSTYRAADPSGLLRPRPARRTPRDVPDRRIDDADNDMLTIMTESVGRLRDASPGSGRPLRRFSSSALSRPSSLAWRLHALYGQLQLALVLAGMLLLLPVSIRVAASSPVHLRGTGARGGRAEPDGCRNPWRAGSQGLLRGRLRGARIGHLTLRAMPRRDGHISVGDPQRLLGDRPG